MFILLVPTMTNEVPIDLPQGPAPTLPVTTHRLVLDRSGGVTLDGTGVSDAVLASRLGALGRDEQATLVMRADPQVHYERALRVLATVKRVGVTRLGFEGLGKSVDLRS